MTATESKPSLFHRVLGARETKEADKLTAQQAQDREIATICTRHENPKPGDEDRLTKLFEARGYSLEDSEAICNAFAARTFLRREIAKQEQRIETGAEKKREAKTAREAFKAAARKLEAAEKAAAAYGDAPGKLGDRQRALSDLNSRQPLLALAD